MSQRISHLSCVRVALGCLSGVFAFAGCGGASGHATVTPSTPSARSAETGTGSTTRGSSISTADHSGLVAIGCTGVGAPRLSFIDPQTGNVTSSETIMSSYPTPTGGTASPVTSGLCSAPANGPAAWGIRERFDAAFSRVVATASHSDGSTSVGYITLATGVFTDVSAPKSSSFSSTAHHDENPLFAPDENSLWFDRILPLPTDLNAPAHHVDVFSVALPNGNPVEIGQSGGAAVPNAWAVAPGHHLVGTGLVLPNPSATVAVADEQALGSLVFVYGTKPGLVAYADLSVTNSSVLERSNSSFIGGTPISLGHNCDPWAWLDSQSLICVETTAQGVTPETTIDRVTLRSGYKTGTTTSLLPGNTRDNADPVLSPGGSRVAFLSIQGETTTLYETGVHASRANPTRIIAFPPATPISYLIGWR